MSFFSDSYSNVSPGYKNPFGSDSTSWKNNTDWNSGDSGINWGKGFGVDSGSITSKYGAKKGFDGEKFGKMANTFASLFDKARSRRGYDPDEYMGGFRGGQIGGGSGGQLLDNLSVVYPQQTGPTFIPGAPARSGGIGDIFSGALSGAGAGSSFGPWGALGGAVLGGIGGAFG